MESNNILRTRIQLKADTEENWNTHPIVPLLNEPIIYVADNNHDYARIKIGDGRTDVTHLKFVETGDYTAATETIETVYNFRRGIVTNAQVENNVFKIKNGQLPELQTEEKTVVTGITREV